MLCLKPITEKGNENNHCWLEVILWSNGHSFSQTRNCARVEDGGNNRRAELTMCVTGITTEIAAGERRCWVIGML